jgi:hypothetical protein
MSMDLSPTRIAVARIVLHAGQQALAHRKKHSDAVSEVTAIAAYATFRAIQVTVARALARPRAVASATCTSVPLTLNGLRLLRGSDLL